MKILVFIEQRNGDLKRSSLEALTLACKTAGGASNVAAVVCGSKSTAIAAQLKGFGADTVYAAHDTSFDNYNPITYAAAFQAAIKSFQPNAVFGIASPMGRDIFPRVAARHGGALLTDLVTLDASANEILGGDKPLYAGKVIANMKFQGTSTRFVTLRPNVFAANECGGAANVTALSVSKDPVEDRIKTVEIRKGASQRADLTEARLIISGGRSLGSAENFKVLHDCAEVIGATVGASRAAVDSGYASHDMQVGQTGKTVNPQLYIACGISGAIQHMAGMRTSKVIVAINTDPEAPIFTIADYGIVADLFTAVPILKEKFKALVD